LMSRDRFAIRSASSLQGICQFPDKARFREAHFLRNVDDRQRLLHRLCRLRMTVTRFASYLRAGARWYVLCRGFHPVHVQGRTVPQGSLPKCRGTNRLRCRRGLEERSKSDPKIAAKSKRVHVRLASFPLRVKNRPRSARLRGCEVSLTAVNRHHQLDREPRELPHLLCLSIASSSCSSDRGEMPSTRNPGKLSEAVVSICISST
jgi:hypothetical protein